MATTNTVPVTVTPEAKAWVAKLGMQRELEQMVEHTIQTVSGLRSIEVTVTEAPWFKDEPTVVIHAHRPHPGGEDDSTDRDWGQWLVNTYPPEICTHFVLMSF